MVLLAPPKLCRKDFLSALVPSLPRSPVLSLSGPSKRLWNLSDWRVPKYEVAMDFPTTREVINEFPGWVNELAETLPKPIQVRVEEGFRWEHETKTVEVAQVAKAVRMAT